jgi:tetratricopeptide (TPR) repeat protein
MASSAAARVTGMFETPLTLKAMSVADAARVRPGWRVAAFAIVLGVALFVGFSLGVARPAQADPVRAEISVDLSNGFARIVLRFNEEIDADVRLANNILVVSFKAPVAINVDRLYSNAAGYVGAARRDPDGMAVRMALSQKVQLSSMMAGERLFIDLLPQSWKGMPPGLPREVVEELAKRAREAERKERQQRLLAQQKQLAPVRLRVAHQPTFSRYIFELPQLVPISSERGKDQLRLVFDDTLKFDLADAQASLPPTIEAIATETADEQTAVTFRFIGKADVRTFREDNNFVVDVSPAGARSERSEPVLPSVSEAVDPGSRGRAAGPPTIETPQAMPVKPTSAAIAEKSAEPLTPAPAVKAPATSSVREAVAAPPAVNAPPATSPATTTDKPGEPAPPVVHYAKSSSTAPADVRTPTVEKAAPTADKPPEAAPSPAAGRVVVEGSAPRKPTDPVKVEMLRQGDNIKLVFPFVAQTPAAVFRRADTLWVVFDSANDIDLSVLNSDTSGTVRNVVVGRSDGGQVLRIKLERPRLTSMSAEGYTWSVTIGDVALTPTKPLSLTRSILGAQRAAAIVAFDDPQKLHRLSDPDVGDTIFAVTGYGPARGFVKTQDFVEFRALASIHGIAIQPLADDVTVEVALDKVVIGRPAGLVLSAGGQASKRSGNYRAQVFDSQLWGFDRQTPFVARQDGLIAAAASAGDTKRTAPRLDLARFYLARDMYPEAKAVLDLALGEERPTAEDSTGLVMRAIANILLGRSEDAARDLGSPLVGNQHNAPLWRAFAQARQGKWVEARDAFRTAGTSISSLPIELQRMVLRESVRAAIEVRDFAGATGLLNEFETLGTPPEIEPSLAILNGRAAEGLGRNEEALAAYRAAADSNDRASAAQGRLREITMRYQLGDLKRSEVISELEQLTTVWRGDETEVEALQLLAKLYTEEARYRDAFYVMRTALKAHPNSEMTRRIQNEAATTFDALFLAGKGDALPAIDALGLFYDFRELTPIGRRGDEMIRRLTDRLVMVDLLDQAAELLQHQVDHRLQGAARAQVANRLAVIYLMNRKPDRALQALRATRTSELSSELRNQRLLLESRALADIGRHDLALEVIANVDGKEAVRLRSDVLWMAKRWREAAEQIELMYGDRWRDWQPLTDAERADLLRAGLGYALGEDRLGLDRFRGKYAAMMTDGAERRAFEVVTAPASANNAEFRDVAKTIAAVDTLDGFLRDMRARYPETGAFAPTSQSSRAPAATPRSQAQLSDPSPTGSIAKGASKRADKAVRRSPPPRIPPLH